MSIETGTDAGTAEANEEVDALARELGDAIADLPAYERFAEAKADVEADDEAQERIREFEQLRQEFAFAQQTGSADEETLEEVKRAQRDLHSLPVMERYVEAQDDLQSRLEDLNEAISDPLAVDFGGEAGGCCQD